MDNQKPTFVLLGLIVVLACWCGHEMFGDPIPVDQPSRITVERVFMHSTNWYSIAVRNKDNPAALQIISFVGGTTNGEHYLSQNFTIFTDAPADQQPWADIRHLRFQHEIKTELLALHLHEANDINGADWNHGKFGHGTTTVLQ